MRIRVICEGKAADARLRALQADYAARIAHFVPIDVDEIRLARGDGRSDKNGITATERRMIEKADGACRVVLDAQGRQWTSAQFARWIAANAVAGARELAFLVGGPEGFSAPFREQADLVLALSAMTLTRDWARALLLEQIYRAFTLERGYPYAR
ncbi:MAG: 23S rRNA (pseudouridine(1915)-N(3))-methyltransferase RlmH [Terriglobia bacterium]